MTAFWGALALSFMLAGIAVGCLYADKPQPREHITHVVTR